VTSRAVLITGCSTGIGRAAALRLARRGDPVYATARRVETLADLAAAGCRTLPLDVTDEASIGAAVTAVEAAHGAVGVLVNNAGYSLQGPIEEVPLEQVRRQFETNVFGAVRLAQLVLPGMRRQRFGRIVNVSSMGGRLTLPGGGFYHGSKYALEAISEALRYEVRGFGVAVSLVEPGPVTTPFGDTALATLRGVPAGAYARFQHELADRIAATYEHPDSRLASSAEQVAAVIERAATGRRPPARYPVGPMARTLIPLRRLLPDPGWEALLRTRFPAPRTAPE
jgi:NAD(P)-dependent dehydrogenase (short-subunit alcohol dehydrogenase family)